MSFLIGLAVTAALAAGSRFLADLVPGHLIGAGVFALLIGMAIHGIFKKYISDFSGVNFVATRILKFAIVLMGVSLNFSQVLHVGKFSLFVMIFTLAAAFGFGNLFGKWFGMNWKLSNLIAAGTGICGGSAIAAISPTIEAEDSDIAYAISATFLFDILMVILFPIFGRAMQMSDLGFGLWTGTAVNDTSSVVAAGFAFSDAAGDFAIVVKLTRTLSIVPIVLIFSYIYQRMQSKKSTEGSKVGRRPVNIKKIFPWFIILFLVMVFFRSMNWLTAEHASYITPVSKFMLVAALGAIGLRTDFKKVAKSGFMPMVHGFIISLIVVLVSLGVQILLQQV